MIVLPFLSISQEDTIKNNDINNKIKDMFSSGNINLGYEYGFLPFLVSLNPPDGNFKTEGNLGLQLGSLPFNASFYYSSLGTISGLNNHFTIKFDSQKYIADKKEKLLKEKNKRLGKIDSLNAKRQKIKTKLGFLYLLKDGKIPLPTPSFNSRNIVNPLDTMQNPLDTITNPFDTLVNPLDTLSFSSVGNIENENLPSLPDSVKPPMSYLESGQEYQDSITNLINAYQDKVSTLENTIKQYQELNNLNLDSLAQNKVGEKTSSLGNKINTFFSGVKKLDFGLTYPNYSEFLVSRIPIRGVNIEYKYKKFNLYFTHGKTVNNIFFSNNVIQNSLNAARNLYNFFDFKNIQDGRRVTAVKLGYGNKEETHFLVGLLSGLGKTSYQDTSFSFDSESNLAAEIDLRLKLKKAHTFDLIYGRSAIQINSINFGEEATLLNKLLNFNERTNALLGRYTIKSKATSIRLTYRLIDPFFRSFGVGFIRSDNVRYEAKIKHKLNKKITLGGYYRRDNDNLLGIYDYQNIIASYGANISIRPNKHWMLKSDVRPIVQNVNSSIDSLSLINNNYIANFILSYNNRIKKTFIFATGIFSYYQLSSEEGLSTYQNINANLSIQHKDKIVNDLIYNRYLTTDTASVPLASILENSFTLKFKKLSMSLIAKASFQQSQELNWGGGLRVTLPISKFISIEASGEKLVFGDFYNSIFQNNLSDFPYYTSVSVKISW